MWKTNRFLFLQPSLKFCPSLFLSRNIGRKGRGTLFVRMPALRDWESGGPELEYITSRQEETKRYIKLDKKCRATLRKGSPTAQQNCNWKLSTVKRPFYPWLFFLFRWPFPHYICNLSSFNTVVIGQLQWHHLLCFAAAFRTVNDLMDSRGVYVILGAQKEAFNRWELL